MLLTPNWHLGFVQPFVILGFTKSLECWATVYYWLLWVIAISFFAFSGPFAKSVSKFFKSLQPSYREQQRKSREDKYKLNNEEASIVEQAVGAKLGQDYDIPALGLPPFDVFTDFDQTEVDHDIQHLRKAWTSFRGRRGSITENDFDGLKTLIIILLMKLMIYSIPKGRIQERKTQQAKLRKAR